MTLVIAPGPSTGGQLVRSRPKGGEELQEVGLDVEELLNDLPDGKMPMSADTLPLPAGAATEATLELLRVAAVAIRTAAESLDSKTSAVDTGAIAGTVALDTATLAALATLPADAATEAAQDAGNTALGDINTALGEPATAAAAADGTGDYPVIGGIKRLALGVAQALANWTTLLGRIPDLVGGRIPVEATAGPALLSSYSVTGVIPINTVLLELDCARHRSVSVQCVAMGTTGVVTLEWSNNGTNWLPATMFTAAGAAATTFNGAGLWRLTVMARFLRLRLSTATTAGTTTLEVHRFESDLCPWLATQPVSGTVTATVTGGTVNPVVPATPYILNSAATENAALILTGTSGLQAFYATNTGASPAFVKLYNKATAPISTDVPAMILPVPAAVDGVPGICPLPIGFSGFRFALGLGIRITGAVADNDTTAVAAGQVKVMLSRTV
jgi:hypothetical protein